MKRYFCDKRWKDIKDIKDEKMKRYFYDKRWKDIKGIKD